MATIVTGKSKNRPRRKFALVFGTGQYSDGQNLPYAENDARKIAAVLQDIGFIIHENGPKLNYTYEQMRIILVQFEESIKEGDMIVFYYAGHGRQWEV